MYRMNNNNFDIDDIDLPILSEGIVYECGCYDLYECEPWKRVPYIFKSLAIMHYNVRDIGSLTRFSELKSDIDAMPFEIDILGISETWHSNGRENMYTILLVSNDYM
jgi:hypothetical protein